MSDDDTYDPSKRNADSSVWSLVLLVFMLTALWDQAISASAAEPERTAEVPALPPCAGKGPAASEPARSRWPAAPLTEADIPAAVGDMTLAEKAAQMVQADISTATPEEVGKHGLGSIISTVPAGDLGATRNPELARRLAEVTARELAATGIRWTFAPSIAVARDIRWGRTYEALGEDVELQQLFAAPMVEGYQGTDLTDPASVGATAKHFIADGATEGGVDRGNAVISDEELRRMHLPGFVDAIESGVVAVMASFSSVNGEAVHGSRALLTDLLKTELGFAGVVVTDWEGVELSGLTLEQALHAGIDMFMLVRSWRDGLPEIVRLVEDGKVRLSRIDDAVTRILRMKLRLGLFDSPLSSAACAETMGAQAHRDIARQAVAESLVPLRNEGGILPLDKDSKVIVAGSHADNVAYQSGGWTKKWQGAHDDRYGHAARPVDGATSIIDGIRNLIGSDRVIDAGPSGIRSNAS
jgi:beta-glucosidase